MSKGIRLALMTAVVSGVSIFANKFGVGIVSSPLLYAALKNTIVGTLIFSLVVLAKKHDELKKLTKEDFAKLFAIGLVGGSIPFYLFFEGLTKTSAINAAMIHKTLFLWVAMLSYPLLKEKLSKLQIMAVAMLYLSNLLIGGFSGFDMSVGELMVLGATLLWSVENIIAKKVLRTVSAEVVTLFRMGVGSLVLWGMIANKGVPVISQVGSMSVTDWSVLAVVSMFLFLYVRTWYGALKIEKATVVSSVLVGSTLVTNILSAVFITHNLSSQALIQFGVIALGVYVFLREERRKLSLSV